MSGLPLLLLSFSHVTKVGSFTFHHTALSFVFPFAKWKQDSTASSEKFLQQSCIQLGSQVFLPKATIYFVISGCTFNLLWDGYTSLACEKEKKELKEEQHAQKPENNGKPQSQNVQPLSLPPEVPPSRVAANPSLMYSNLPAWNAHVSE